MRQTIKTCHLLFHTGSIVFLTRPFILTKYTTCSFTGRLETSIAQNIVIGNNVFRKLFKCTLGEFGQIGVQFFFLHIV